MNDDVLDFIKKVEVRGIILSGVVEDSACSVVNQITLLKIMHLELIKGIDFLLDNDSEFFLLERLFDCRHSIKDICFEIINDYRFKYKDNYDLCNRVIGKINMLNVVPLRDKHDDLVNYFTKEMMSRGIVFDDMSVCLDAMFYDYYIYNSIQNDDINDIDYYDAVVSTTNYFLNNIPQIYNDSKIYDSSMILLNRSIKNSRVFSGAKKSAKYTKKKLQEKIRIHE